MIGKLLDVYSHFFAKVKFRKFNKFLFLAGARGLGILNYKTSWASGEEPFLRRFLMDYDNSDSIVLDVGANKGQFASWVLRNSSKLKVLSFEPNPAAAVILKKNIDSSKRHLLIEKGVSSSIKIGKIYDYSKNAGSGHASMYNEVITEIHNHKTFSETPIELTTIDHELETLPTKRVCLLKIDTEGHEKDVLIGSKILLSSNPPAAVLVEFNEMNAVSNTQFRTIKQLIGDKYIPYRLLPGGSLLPLKGQSPLYTEIYAYQNLVFLREN
ncbi:FkbM family methyltransferase [Synechococcus sp. M16.1]|uniref:FkbM family methyltransferase n=1 Tax=Synechococcus sp. M16.1 TaxID=1442553 RepID=UPI0016456E1C|nr:FkbM family methyltransferase [Synechococcus sp. M16.1]